MAAHGDEVGTVRVGDYLIERLCAHGVEHIFGVPGDFVLGFMKDLEDSPLTLITTRDEQGAGFAADAYARLRGLGTVCVTYGVGGLKVTNTTGKRMPKSRRCSSSAARRVSANGDATR